MYVVIAGGGVLGQGLARRLVGNRHDVVVVEQDMGVCETISSRIGALAVRGNATSYDTLEEAGLDKADIAVAATPSDADNLAFCLLARNFDVPRLMSRLTDPRYEAAYEMAGVDRTLNMSELFVNRIVLEVEQPALRQVATFGRGQAAIVVARVPEDGFVAGKTVQQIGQSADFPQNCVIAGIYREEEEKFIIPRGAVELHGNDQVFLASEASSVRKAADFLQQQR